MKGISAKTHLDQGAFRHLNGANDDDCADVSLRVFFQPGWTYCQWYGQGPGSYKFSDTIKVGLPLTLVVMVVFLVSSAHLNHNPEYPYPGK